MAGDSAPQTPRRSRRFQPLATPFLQRQTTKSECAWEGEPIHVRPCNPDFDLMHEERDEREQQADGEGEMGNVEPQGEEETVFYAKFTLKRPKAKPARPKQTASGEEILTFRLGDTITVETDTLYRQRRPPSVAVITSMWEVKKKGEDDAEHDPSKMRLRVHWFLRPSELAAIREKREHRENEIYYSLTSSDILVPSVIVSRCAVSSHKTPSKNKDKGNEKRSYVPVKSKHTPARKGSSSTALVADLDVDEEDEDTCPSATAEEMFYCYYAINSQRGLYYNFKWDCHHATALKASSEIPEEGVARTTWGCGKEWNVDTAESLKRTKKARPPPRKRVKMEGGGGGESSGEDVDSESEAEFESDSDDEDMDDVEESDEEDADGDDDDEADGLEPRTPSKSRKRKRGQVGLKTPRKKRSSIAQPTPHSKQALRKRRNLKAAVNGSPRKTKTGKFTSRQPNLSFKTDMSRLPPDPWLRAMHVLHVGNRPEALPCREKEYEKVLACVGELLEEGSGGCVYISGVPGTGKTATVHTVINQLKQMAKENEINPFTYVEINGLRIPEPSVAYTLLWEAISRQEGVKTDNRMSANHSLKALTHHFGRPTRGPAQHSYVVLMDELDQLVTPKQDVIYNFFNWPTLANSRLIVVAVANTMDLPERVMTGRVRSRLGMTRINFPSYTTHQLVEIVEARLATIKDGLDEESAKREVMTRDAIKYVAMTVCRITGDARRVLDARVVEFASATKITAKPNHATKIVKAMQSSPTAGYLQDCSLHERIMLASLIRCVRREGVEEIKWDDVQYQHLNYIGALTGSTDSQRKPTIAELTSVLDSLVASRAILLEDGPSVARKPVGERRMLLNIEQIEVERVLSDVGGQTWKNVLSS